ncbi:hypothetical protein F5Y10DRAFT_290016 [Nemania abortiva]|nr:hypothetical protein F5Y10DRAFT_290016 [Nemania abortiva]
MGTRGLEIYRYRGRYYLYRHQFDGYYEGLGADIIDRIPADPEDYQKWLEYMRAKYADKQSALEEYVYEIRDGSKPDYNCFNDLEALPSELPRLDCYNAEYFYIINLDCEVLTMNFGIHWKLGHIPRKNELWIRAIRDSILSDHIYQYQPTISLDICPDEYIASPALELPEMNPYLGYRYDVIAPKLDISKARKAFLTRVLAEVLIQYKDNILRFGVEWSPASFPFRELTFALVSIASGTAEVFPFPDQRCNRCAEGSYCDFFNHWPKTCGFLNEQRAGNLAPLLEFGSMSHRPGDAPGVSPAETMYWLGDVLVSLTLRNDGGAVTKAVSWGLDQGRENFQIVVLSLFQVTLAEVSRGKDKGNEPLVRVSNPIDLSPLRQDYCMSTHPRERPELKDGMGQRYQTGRILGQTLCAGLACTGAVRRLQSDFPGLAALVNFFDVAADRRVASKSAGILPNELYDQILEYVDYNTWRTCASVSTAFRYSCFRKYRIDDKTRIIAGPFVRLQRHFDYADPLLSFEFEHMQTGQVLPVIERPKLTLRKELNWMPLIGSDRKAVMLDVFLQFEPAVDIPVENDGDDGSLSHATRHTIGLPTSEGAKAIQDHYKPHIQPSI